MAEGSESDAALEGLLGTSNRTLLARPVLRTTLVASYPIIVTAYALLVMCGALLNLALLAFVGQRRLHRQPTMCLMANLAVAHLLECLVGLPITLAAILFSNWFMGQFLCYFLPMLQDVPTHVSVMSFVIMAYDRYRFIEDPSKPRLPAVVFAVGSWLTASCIIVPYPIYTTYLEIPLSMTGNKRDGKPTSDGAVQLCWANLSEDIQDYTRCIFVFMYVIPAIVLSYLFAQTTRILKLKETPVTLVLYDTRSTRSPRSSTASVHTYRRSIPIRASLYHAAQTDSAELDLRKEKRTQKYLMSMTAAFYVLFAPLNLMRVMQSHLNETYENSKYFDLAWVTCVWVGYLPTCSIPLLFASWMLSRSEKERVRGYFRFSNRRLTRSAQRSTGSDIPLAGDGGGDRCTGTPGPSPPHAAGLALRTGSVATASTAITNLSPPSSPRPTPRPSPRPARGGSVASAEPPPLGVPAGALQPLSEVNLMRHDLQRAPSQRGQRVPASPLSPSTLSSTSSSRNTNSSSSYGPVHNPFLPPLCALSGLPTHASGLVDVLGDSQVEASHIGRNLRSDSTAPSTPSSVASGMVGELSRQPSFRTHHHRMSSRRRKQPDITMSGPQGSQGPQRQQGPSRKDNSERKDAPQRIDGLSRLDSSRIDGLSRIDSSRVDGLSRLDSSRVDGLSRLDSSRVDGLSRLDSSRVDGLSRLDSSRVDGLSRLDSTRVDSLSRLDSSRVDSLSRIDSSRVDGLSRSDSSRTDFSQRGEGTRRADVLHRQEQGAGQGPQSFHQAVNQGLHKPPQPPRYFTFDHVHPHYYRP